MKEKAEERSTPLGEDREKSKASSRSRATTGATAMSTRIPRAARAYSDITKLSHDNVVTGDFSLMLEETKIYLAEQPWGGQRRQHLVIPRKVFDAFVDWYQTGKVPPGDRAARIPPKETADV